MLWLAVSLVNKVCTFVRHCQTSAIFVMLSLIEQFGIHVHCISSNRNALVHNVCQIVLVVRHYFLFYINL